MKNHTQPLSPEMQQDLKALEKKIFADCGPETEINHLRDARDDEYFGMLTADLEEFGAAAVPVLSRILGHRSVAARREACEILSSIGPAAKDAIPALLNMDFAYPCGFEPDWLKVAATNALEKIQGSSVPPDK